MAHGMPAMIRDRRNGFTLMEMSSVLIVIALVVGAVLLGSDLVEAARIRRQISQIREFDAAANAFRAKFNYWPGDLPPASADELGFKERSGDPGEGDADGFVNAGASYAGGLWLPPAVEGETLLFWMDLSSAGLIAAAFTE